MSKGSGGTRSSSSSNPRGTGTSGNGMLKGNSFNGARFSQFEGSMMVNGGSYSLTSKDGYTMSIDIENESDHSNVIVSMMKGADSRTYEQISYFQVDSGTIHEGSGGYRNLGNDSQIAKSINNMMPYLAEQADKYKKRNK